MTIRTIILSGLLLCGGLASGKNELSFKETVVPVKVAPDQDSITASFPFTNTSGVPVTISKIHVSCDCTTAGAIADSSIFRQELTSVTPQFSSRS